MEWSLFAGVPADRLAEVLQSARRRTFRRGEVVFHEGDPGDSLHLVESGHVAARVMTPYGETATLRVIGPGEFFGELAVVAPGPRSASVAALEGCTTLVLHRDQIEHLRREAPGLDRALLESVIDEVRRLTGQLLDAMYVPAQTRLARRLVDLASAYPVDASGDIVIPLTQDDLAGLCGVARPTVNQLVGKLVERELVAVGRGKIIVRNLEGLESRAR